MSAVQSFVYYEGAEGNNKVFKNRSSGAYIFRPKEASSKNFVYTGSYKIYKGETDKLFLLLIKCAVSLKFSLSFDKVPLCKKFIKR